MKKKIDKYKTLILISGISAIVLILGILAVTVYFGLKYNEPLLPLLKFILFEINFQMSFFLLNSILIAIVCVDLRFRKLASNYYNFFIILSLVMLVINLTLIFKNIMAFNSALFWLLFLIFQYQNRKAVKLDESIQKA